MESSGQNLGCLTLLTPNMYLVSKALHFFLHLNMRTIISHILIFVLYISVYMFVSNSRLDLMIESTRLHWRPGLFRHMRLGIQSCLLGRYLNFCWRASNLGHAITHQVPWKRDH